MGQDDLRERLSLEQRDFSGGVVGQRSPMEDAARRDADFEDQWSGWPGCGPIAVEGKSDDFRIGKHSLPLISL
jgi:hypothetical protein